MNAKVEVRAEPGHCYSLFVGGIRMVDRESMQVVDNIKEALFNAVRYPSECGEVADSIIRWAQRSGITLLDSNGKESRS